MSYTLFRRNSTRENELFWREVESDVGTESAPPPEVVELLADGVRRTPIAPERLDTIREWAPLVAGWKFDPKPLYVRDAEGDLVDL